jgi:hypothetical protein
MTAFLNPVYLPQLGISRGLLQSDQEGSWERNWAAQDLDKSG